MFNNVAAVIVVVLMLVIWALADVIPVDKLRVASLAFVYVILVDVNVPVEILVSTTFVVVMFTVVMVPPITKSPLKLMDPPVYVVAAAVPALIVVPIILVARKVPTVSVVTFKFVIWALEVVKFVETMFVIVLFVAYTAPVVSDVVILAVPDTSRLFAGEVVPIPMKPLACATVNP